jgi:hypothetical protein
MERCPELLFGAPAYFAALAVVVGATVRLVKLIPWVKPNAVPAVAFAIGWLCDLVVGLVLCGRADNVPEAVALALAGGLAGLAAAGGHDALSGSAKLVGLGWLADRLLGSAATSTTKRGGA